MIVTGAVVFLTIAGVLCGKKLFAGKDTSDHKGTKTSGYEYYYKDNDHPEDKDVESSSEPGATKAPLIQVDTDPESITVLVNREYLLPEEYIPEDLVVPDVPFSFYGTYEKSYMRKAAAAALEKLFAGAKEQNISLKGVSAYRSYSRQKEIYNRNVSTKGKKKANQVSAFPGSSEHQTGLTIDVSADSIGCALEQSFGKTIEGKWLANNCYKYGFTIRYPKEKEDITGYSYEPWHIRYVGKNLAKRLYKKKLTLEEYYQTTTVDKKVKPEDQVKDTDTGAPKEHRHQILRINRRKHRNRPSRMHRLSRLSLRKRKLQSGHMRRSQRRLRNQQLRKHRSKHRLQRKHRCQRRRQQKNQRRLQRRPKCHLEMK